MGSNWEPAPAGRRKGGGSFIPASFRTLTLWRLLPVAATAGAVLPPTNFRSPFGTSQGHPPFAWSVPPKTAKNQLTSLNRPLTAQTCGENGSETIMSVTEIIVSMTEIIVSVTEITISRPKLPSSSPKLPSR
jgi:hypothetical protein